MSLTFSFRPFFPSSLLQQAGRPVEVNPQNRTLPEEVQNQGKLKVNSKIDSVHTQQEMKRTL